MYTINNRGVNALHVLSNFEELLLFERGGEGAESQYSSRYLVHVIKMSAVRRYIRTAFFFRPILFVFFWGGGVGHGFCFLGALG